jgi:methylenetetrahydrofolate reductase (NADPH)
MSDDPRWGDVPVERLRECPKLMTNGPCGGVTLDGACEVDRGHLCVWYEALKDTREPDVLRRANAPDWTQDFTQAFAPENLSAIPSVAALPDCAHKPLVSGSRMERLLRAGHFVVTAELNPHDSADAGALVDYARTLAPCVDAAHISDNPLATPHMCGLAVAALVQQVGIEPILHMTCRDRNRLMLQADLLGAHALGVRNILCLTGDHPAVGDHPAAKPVFDLDSNTWLAMARRMRDEGRFMHGERLLDVKPRVFLGGAAGPTAPPTDFRPQRLLKKLAAGADFIVTQLVFDMDLFKRFVQQVEALGLLNKTYLFVGVAALDGPDMAALINRETPGVFVPDALLERLRRTPVQHRKREGIAICVEQIQQLREMPGICGVDIIDLDPRGWFPTIEIVERAGLSSRPRLPEQSEV